MLPLPQGAVCKWARACQRHTGVSESLLAGIGLGLSPPASQSVRTADTGARSSSTPGSESSSGCPFSSVVAAPPPSPHPAQPQCARPSASSPSRAAASRPGVCSRDVLGGPGWLCAARSSALRPARTRSPNGSADCGASAAGHTSRAAVRGGSRARALSPAGPLPSSRQSRSRTRQRSACGWISCGGEPVGEPYVGVTR